MLCKLVHYSTYILGRTPWLLPVPSLEKGESRRKSYKPPAGTNPFKLHAERNPFCVRRFAQRLANYHCHLMNIHKFKYLAFHDLDEILMPRKHQTLPQLFNSLEHSGKINNAASVVFQHAKFCFNSNTTDYTYGNQSALHSTVRLPVFMGAPKIVIVPDRSSLTGIHSVVSAMKGYQHHINLEAELGTLNHYRVPSMCGERTILNDSLLLPVVKKLEAKVEMVKRKTRK